jgi:DNA-binding protein HU-beta
MNKQALIGEIAVVVQDRKAATAAMESLMEHIGRSLENGEMVSIGGFGTFKVVERQARTGRNPKTGETLSIPARRTVKFIPAKAMRDGLSD